MEEVRGMRRVVVHRAAVDAIPAVFLVSHILWKFRPLIGHESKDELEPYVSEAD